jgi:hypothetical protein
MRRSRSLDELLDKPALSNPAPTANGDKAASSIGPDRLQVRH